MDGRGRGRGEGVLNRDGGLIEGRFIAGFISRRHTAVKATVVREPFKSFTQVRVKPQISRFLEMKYLVALLGEFICRR